MDEEIKKPVEKTEDKTEDKPISIVDEARTIRDEIKAEKEALIKEREELQKVQSEALLSGTAGAPVQAKPAVEETPKEYNERIDKELSEGKHNE